MELYVRKGPKNGPQNDINLFIINYLDCVAERGGFEPPIELLTL